MHSSDERITKNSSVNQIDLLGFSGIGDAKKSSLGITRPEAESALSQNSVAIVSATTKQQETHLLMMSCVGVLVFKHRSPYARDVGSSHFIYLCYGARVQTTQIPDMLFHGDNVNGIPKYRAP